jgi:hypothetical protein
MVGEMIGCQLTEHLYESENSLVYRGYQGSSDRPVIIKILKEDYPMRLPTASILRASFGFMD